MADSGALASGAALFAKLQSVAGPDADASLYFDDAAGWDVDALLSDMSVYGLDISAEAEAQPQQPLRPQTRPTAIVAPPAPLYSPAHAAAATLTPGSPEPSFQEMLASATPLHAAPAYAATPYSYAPPAQLATPPPTTSAGYPCSAGPPSSQSSWQTVGPTTTPMSACVALGSGHGAGGYGSGSGYPGAGGFDDGVAENEAATRLGTGGWLVDLIEGKKKPAEMLQGGLSWLRQQATGEAGGGASEPAEAAPAFVYNAEVGAWMPRDMTAEQWLAQEAEQTLRDALKAAPPPPPTFGAPPPGAGGGVRPAGAPPAGVGAPLPMGSADMGGAPPLMGGGGPAVTPGAGGGFRRPTGKMRPSDHYRAQAGM